MTMVILTADVEDAATWEREYRTHGHLFKAAGIGTVQYNVSDDGLVVVGTDVADVDAYMAFLNSEATQDAMKNDGVKRDTVSVVVLDKHFAG